METYYIYHIPGVKIGVSVNPKRRVKRQGYTEFEILEEHTDIDLVSQRELELQFKYGYKKDCSIYSISGTRSKPKEVRQKLSNSLKGRKFTEEWVEKIRVGNRGKGMSESHRAIISKVNKGNQHLYGKGRRYIEHTTGFVGTLTEMQRRWPGINVLLYATRNTPLKKGQYKGLHFAIYTKDI